MNQSTAFAPNSFSAATPTELAVVRQFVEQRHADFVRVYFKVLEGSDFIFSHHHSIMCDVADAILRGDANRVIVNVPPGYTKTVLLTIMLIAHGFALNPASRFIHTSYSEPLVNDNSMKVRDVIHSPQYQMFWPIRLRPDQSAKGLWKTTRGGGLLAQPAGGTITGFRAGTMDKNRFTGAFVIDDPLKPDDAFSSTKRDFINNRFNNTFRSRLGHEGVPIVVVMQRVHEEDLSGFLLRGGGGKESWDHIILPALVEDDRPYRVDYTHGRPWAIRLPAGPLWEHKHDREQLDALAADDYVFASQYQQDPAPIGGAMFKAEWLAYYTEPPRCAWRKIYVDTAQKTKEQNDYSVFQCWGRTFDRRAVLLDQLRGKFEAPELEEAAVTFWKRHANKDLIADLGPLRAMSVEDKASGTGLIQSLKHKHLGIIVEAMPREKDKIIRGMNIAPFVKRQQMVLPDPDSVAEVKGWMPQFLSEFLRFPRAPHDDQVDPAIDALEDMLRHSTMLDVIE